MIHAYHVIFGAYGFWLPNDPRGSWSEFVGRWELVRFGKATKSIQRTELTPEEERSRREAKQALKYPPVEFTGLQARAVGGGFAKAIAKSGFSIWACAILPEHVHAIVARHRYKVEQIVGQLKGEATKELRRENLDPLAAHATADTKPSPWADHCWKVYLDNEDAIQAAIQYVEENPIKEGKPKQNWSFVTPFGGIDRSGWTTYH